MMYRPKERASLIRVRCPSREARTRMSPLQTNISKIPKCVISRPQGCARNSRNSRKGNVSQEFIHEHDELTEYCIITSRELPYPFLQCAPIPTEQSRPTPRLSNACPKRSSQSCPNWKLKLTSNLPPINACSRQHIASAPNPP
jgi:hypothetical protein